MKSKKNRSQGVFLKIANETHEVLEQIAEKEERTMASVIRQAIKEYLEKRKGK